MIDWYQAGYDDGFNAEPYGPPLDPENAALYYDGWMDGDEDLTNTAW